MAASRASPACQLHKVTYSGGEEVLGDVALDAGNISAAERDEVTALPREAVYPVGHNPEGREEEGGASP